MVLKLPLVDVREKRKWDQGHLDTAVLVPLRKLMKKSESKDFVEQLAKTLLQDKIIYWHCWSVRRYSRQFGRLSHLLVRIVGRVKNCPSAHPTVKSGT